jgi:hypothetical protein
MATWSVSEGSGSVNAGFGIRTSAKLNAKGYAQITGVRETRNFMLRMAKDYRTYNSWMKRGAQIVAAEGRRRAPIKSGQLARKIDGKASARVLNKYGQKSTMIGGVVVANTPYGKSVSFGRYYPFGRYTIRRSKTGPAFEGIRFESIRSDNKNTYLKKAREASKPHVVALWNSLLQRYIRVNGYEYQKTS